MTSIGGRIKAIRQARGLTLEQFGVLACNANKSNVLKWEQNKTKPNNARTKAIAEIGGITVEELLHGKTETSKASVLEYTGRLTAVSGRSATFTFAQDLDIEKIRMKAGSGEIVAAVCFYDKDMMTPEQRKKIYALINDICEHTGYSNDEMLLKMKYYFMAETGCDTFSLANGAGVTKIFASRFLEFMLNWCLALGVPFLGRDYHLTADQGRVLFIYTVHKVCFVCGKPGDIHHLNGYTVGMGNDRRKINNAGRVVACLCREHHGEIHQQGEAAFMALHHLTGVKLTAALAIRLGLPAE
jgi:transcriptional regulator with XRE-family HTH domain